MKTLTSFCSLLLIFTFSFTSQAHAEILKNKTEVNVDGKVQVRSDAKITEAKARADKELDRRITALTKLSTHIQAMKHVSVTQKSAIAASTQSQIATLTTLKAKIDADTDISVLKTDVTSITGSYRIYALVIPQGEILTAADRILTIADEFTQVQIKLQAGITQGQQAGKDVTALQNAFTDLSAKVGDAKVQANTSISGVATLTPDNGDATKASSNKQALVDARAKLKLGSDDLKSARKSAETIVKGLKALSISTSATSKTTVQ